MTVRRRGALPALGVLAIVLVSLNLRAAIAGVAPVVDELSRELALTTTTAGLLTTLPVLCFAFLAPVAAWLGRHLTAGRAVLLSLVVVAAGIVIRVLGGTALLLAGTVATGIGLAIGNVMVPVAIKRDFPDRVATATGLFTASLSGGAALAAALTTPLSSLGGGWRFGLGAWALMCVPALLVWWAVVVRSEEPHTVPVRPSSDGEHGPRPVWRQPMAWFVALVLGSQSLLYYAITAWLPALLRDQIALDRALAGNAMSVFQLIGIPASLAVPVLCRRRPEQSWLGLLCGGAWIVMVAGLLAAPSWWLLWAVVGGVAQGAGIAFAMTLVVLRAADHHTVRELSGMSQAVGYSLGALGPVVFGGLRSATAGWTVPLLFLAVMTAVLAVSGMLAGRDRAVS